jgi:hypothetical protein
LGWIDVMTIAWLESCRVGSHVTDRERERESCDPEEAYCSTVVDVAALAYGIF